MMVYKVNLLYQVLLFSTALLMVRCGQTTPVINETPESILQAGAASAPVNPEIGSYIAGDKQNRKFTGIQDSLFVKAIVLNDGATSIAIITVDCIGLMYPDIEKIREKASSLVNSINLPPENINIIYSYSFGARCGGNLGSRFTKFWGGYCLYGFSCSNSCRTS